MCFYIGIEDLAANALIEILQTKQGDLSQYSVSYGELQDYGTEVVHYLNTKGEEAVLIFSRESTNCMLHNYSEFFEETKEGTAIALKEGKTVPDLIERFRTYLSFDVMMAFMAENTVQVLKKGNGRG